MVNSSSLGSTGHWLPPPHPVLRSPNSQYLGDFGRLYARVICPKRSKKKLTHTCSSFGNGTSVTTTLIALISNAAAQDQAITTASSYLFRSLGSVLGLSAQSAVLQGVLRVRLAEKLGGGDEAVKLADKIRESLEYTRTLPPDVQEVVRRAYSNSVTAMFSLVTAILCGALVSSRKHHLPTPPVQETDLCTVFINEKRLTR